MIDGHKQCSSCGSLTPVAEFAEHNVCRPCKGKRQASWATQNPDYWPTWQRANPDKLSATAHRRRAQKLGRDSEQVDRSLVFERDGFTCQLCNLPILMAEKFPHPFSPSLDHIIPLNKGGHHLYSNIQAAHFVCNSAKGDRLT
ncbi:HNH endonuclease [Arthrobacter sp. UYP6]|uniref:HNH endonuclease n=1 Tax=Arthrobacter sp. UYP6 TaxID=1756378 RepID=UPI0033990650